MPSRRLCAFLLACLPAIASISHANELDRVPSSLISKNCIDCHSGNDAEGELNLAALLKKTAAISPANLLPDDVVDSWVKVEKAVLQQRMPPPAEGKLAETERQQLKNWIHARIVLKAGKPHIGPTPLRRLTHYEFLNSLEDLLGVTVRAEYNFLSSVNVERSFVQKLLPVEVPGKSGFVNDAHALASQPFPLLEYIKCVDFALSKISKDKESLKRLFGFDKVPKKLTDTQVREIAARFLNRALRGRSTDEHVSRGVAVFRKASSGGKTMRALKAMLRGVLLLPEFYYRLETSKGLTAPYRVSDFELASRLSYFLTCSTPDDTLLTLAKDGKLSSPKILEQQITRLLNQPRRISLSERFAAQWIGFEELINDAQFDESGVPTTNRAQYDELLYFFDELVKSNRSVLDIIDSDWAYVSGTNIRTYGRNQFRRRKPFEAGYANVLEYRRLTGKQRRGIERIYDPPTLQTVVGDRYGGVITTAAVMRITSAPKRTSPVRRGVWLLDKMIGEKLEAPKNVPPIEKAVRSLPIANPSKLQIIKAHTEMASCKICHQSIDPLGFGLENFGPTGRWRSKYQNKRNVVSRGVLPGGKSFSSPKQLKQQLLVVYRERIVRNFIRRLMSYAIGRSLQPYDRVTLDRIYQRVVAGGFRSGVVLREIINSPQFRSRQDKG